MLTFGFVGFVYMNFNLIFTIDSICSMCVYISIDLYSYNDIIIYFILAYLGPFHDYTYFRSILNAGCDMRYEEHWNSSIIATLTSIR